MHLVASTAETVEIEIHPHRDTLTLVPQAPEVALVTVERDVPVGVHDELFTMYAGAFSPLAARAALCHLLSREHFTALLVDPDVMKVVAWDQHARPIGLATLTTDLSTELVGAEFYATRFPEAHAAGQLYYLGFLLVRPDAQRSGVLPRLIEVLVDQVSAEGGVIAFDVCGYNDETFQFAQRASRLAAQVRPSTLERVDVQTYYAVSFPSVG